MDGMGAVERTLKECGVAGIYAVPGYPITGLAEQLIGQMPNARWVINEKIAFEMAFGGSVCGERTCVLVKHVGMNVLSDALITSATHTIGAGLVVMTGDDPLADGSQNEQDSRYYGLIAEVAVFDPTPRNLGSCIAQSYVLSERTRAPTIVRLTSRLLGAQCEREKVSIPPEPLFPYEHDVWELTFPESTSAFTEMLIRSCATKQSTHPSTGLPRGAMSWQWYHLGTPPTWWKGHLRTASTETQATFLSRL